LVEAIRAVAEKTKQVDCEFDYTNSSLNEATYFNDE
jgi:hypothetical protein